MQKVLYTNLQPFTRAFSGLKCTKTFSKDTKMSSPNNLLPVNTFKIGVHLVIIQNKAKQKSLIHCANVQGRSSEYTFLGFKKSYPTEKFIPITLI